MLAIRMQRTGRSGHAQFRVIVQDSRFSPKRGRVVSYLGSYNPHTKTAQLDTVKASEYLKNGAQPSDTVARLFKKEGIKLPAWVKLEEPKKGEVRNPEKRRSTAPAQPAEASADPPVAEEPAAAEAEAATAESSPETEIKAEEPTPEAPAEEAPAEPPAEPNPVAEDTTTETPSGTPAES